jgi:hypothetical protein
MLAAALALERGWALNLGGGMHHASTDAGGGWCPYADLHLAMRRLRAASSGRLRRFMVIDLDVHQVSTRGRAAPGGGGGPEACHTRRERCKIGTRCPGLFPPELGRRSHCRSPPAPPSPTPPPIPQGNGVGRCKQQLGEGDEETFIVDVFNGAAYPWDTPAKQVGPLPSAARRRRRMEATPAASCVPGQRCCAVPCVSNAKGRAAHAPPAGHQREGGAAAGLRGRRVPRGGGGGAARRLLRLHPRPGAVQRRDRRAGGWVGWMAGREPEPVPPRPCPGHLGLRVRLRTALSAPPGPPPPMQATRWGGWRLARKGWCGVTRWCGGPRWSAACPLCRCCRVATRGSPPPA